MKRITIAALALTVLGAITLTAQDVPQMPAPAKEHEWLKKLVGNWEFESEIFMKPDAAPMKTKSTEVVRSVGGFWVASEGKSEMMGQPFVWAMTLGFDPASKKYVGTWIDSMSSFQWRSQGSVDATGNILTLESEGPCPKRPGTLTKFRDVTEFKSNDERAFTSSMQDEDGKWVTMVRGTARRVK